MSEHAVSAAPARSAAIVGPGRAGRCLGDALANAGWTIAAVAGRSPDSAGVRAAARQWDARAVAVGEVARWAEVVVIATPDRAIAETARDLAPSVNDATLVVHLSGATGVVVLNALPCRTGALHPLHTMPEGGGSGRLAGAWCAVSGDAQVGAIARDIGMVPFAVADADRPSYHAAACIASNHLVALLAQVEACTAVPLEAFLPLVRATVDNVAATNPTVALTGPVSRGDSATVRAHLAAVPDAEREAYRALARRAAIVAGRPPDLDGVLT